MDAYDTLAEHMNSLGLQITGTELSQLSVAAGKQQMENIEFLSHVVAHLLEEKRQRSFDMLLKLSGIPLEKTLESFDFRFPAGA